LACLSLVVRVATAEAAQAQPLRLHGVAYGPFRDGQSPATGVFPTQEQIAADQAQISTFGDRIRTYSVKNTQGDILALARKRKLGLYAGAWIGADAAANDAEIVRLLALARRHPPTALVVGNEVLLRGDLASEALLELVRRVDDASKLPVAYADTWNQWLEHPELAAAVDVLLVHIHPYWDGVPVEQAASYVLERFEAVKQRYPTKLVVIGETGWPTSGATVGAAVPGEGQQCRFLGDFVTAATSRGVPYFWFAAYDEAWKQAESGLEAEAHWGLLSAARTAKPCIPALLAASPPLVEITDAAKCGAGSNSHGRLRGRVFGLSEPDRKDYRIVLFAGTPTWYVQPTIASPFTRISRKGVWKRGTHLGDRYAALLVTPDYDPPATTSELPEIGGDVLAIGTRDCSPG
jgi:exo-beta-1,3-glucanase (GH17 family)